jgi:putative ABC transport system ATP-binding protein
MHNPLIQIQGLHKYYVMDGVQVHALRGIDLEVARGDFLAIMGPSGSGKSTLMHILGCLDTPDKGSYRLNGKDVTHMDSDALATLRNREIGFVFQSFNLLPRTTAIENVETPMIYAGINRKRRHERAAELLQRMGLGDRLYHLPSQLSGGQQQRVAIARALIISPALLLADEPTGNMDTRTSHEIMEIFCRLNREQGLTILLITHEPEIAARASRSLTLRDGLLEELP